MDVLSDVMAVTRTGRPRSARVSWHAPWGQRFPSVGGAPGFQVVLQGTCWLVAVDEAPVRLIAGDVVFLPHGRGHTLVDSLSTDVAGPACDPDDPQFAEPYAMAEVDPTGGDGPVTVVLCGTYRADPSRSHPLLRDLPDTIHLAARLGRHPELRAAVDLLALELERPRLGTDAAIPALLETMLLYILRAWFDEQPRDASATGWAAALNDPAVFAALQAIHRDPAAPWTVATLAGEAGLSRAPFARRFTDRVGQPPLTYLTWWRMTTAARVLRSSDSPLRLVAAAVGYESEFAFSHAFKRSFGMAPGIYRRSGQAGQAM